ncbi:hypothetical protein SNE40_022593 [Patella caerulea]|uniref:DUF4371 domain-containing protein n=1 Tax=Patella caerulea TaxID=87958 RepID=A0AAN8G119_PATCE
MTDGGNTTTSSTDSSTSGSASSSQPKINTYLNSFTRNAYERQQHIFLLHRGCHNVQKSNGVQLIDGVDNSAKGREFGHELALAAQQKLCQIIDSSKFFTILSDGSLTRKTGSEKELVFVRTVRNGTPEIFQNVDNFGDATAENHNTAIDDVFKNIEQEQYTKKLVAATADGTSVNMGCYNGLLTRMKQDNRHWLLIIHCVSSSGIGHQRYITQRKDF